ncbi:MAG: hypothetical protein N3D10_01005 [Candidatus Micrarchaeota archaeon]|nr:hypothetical protein [Candidatus Micrarchaeota archaeon]
MFKPAKMKKVKMIGLLQDLNAALILWRRLGVIQLDYYSYENLNIEKGKALDIYEVLSEQLLKLRTAKNFLIPKKEITPMALEKNPLEMAKEININDKLLEIENSLKELSKEQENLKKQIAFLNRIEPLNINFSLLPKSLDYYLFSINKKKFAQLKETLNQITTTYDLLAIDDLENKENYLVFLAIEKEKDVSKISSFATFLEIPKINSYPKNHKLALQLKLNEIEDKLNHLLYQKVILSEQYYETIVRLEEALALEADLAREALKFGVSKSCFFATGWIKESDFERFKNTTLKFFEGRILISEIPPSVHHYNNCPTLLENPKVVKPFENILNFLFVPKATEIDPSALIFLSIPLVYAMIVGDAGYALLSMIISLFIIFSAPKGGLLEALGKIWLISSVPTLFFGILFDEYFGFTHEHLLGTKLYKPLLHRAHEVPILLAYSILVGWLLIAFGFILGAINSISHSLKHALAKVSWLILQIGLTLAVAGFLFSEFSSFLVYGLVIFFVGAIGLIAFEGFLAVVEIPGLISNIMSFSRVTAVGVAGLILAEAINKFLFPKAAGPFSIEGALSFLFIFFVYTLLHFVNTFIAMFEGFLHSARLSFLEFFTKFFVGGGKLFSPLKLIRKYTLDKDEKTLKAQKS